MDSDQGQLAAMQQSNFPWHLGVHDAHCHPTDTMSQVAAIATMRAKSLTIMATRDQDQELVARIADTYTVSDLSQDNTRRIIPCFGWHPWFSHMLCHDACEDEDTMKDAKAFSIKHYRSVLIPEPKDSDIPFLASLPIAQPLGVFLTKTRNYLDRYPMAIVGEIGLDKSFRLPLQWSDELQQSRDETLTPGGREGRQLSSFRVSMEHQKKVLKAQLHLAGVTQRAVSVHGVQAHGVLYDVLEESWKGHELPVIGKKKQLTGGSLDSPPSSPKSAPFPPKICLHSYSGSFEGVKRYLHPAVPSKIFFSFSTAINLTVAANLKTTEIIQFLPFDRILVESDLHVAGEDMDKRLEEMYRTICQVKMCTLDHGVEQIAQNYEDFVGS